MHTSQVSSESEQTHLLVDDNEFTEQDIPAETTNNIRPLDDLVFGHAFAVFLECIFCLIFGVVVTYIWYFHSTQYENANVTYIIQMCLILSGLLGGILTYIGVKQSRSVLTIGAFKTMWWVSYTLQYYFIIAIMVLIDVCVRFAFRSGTGMLIAISNWCALIGSASATSFLILDIPYLSLRSFTSNDANHKCASLCIALLLQIGQCAVTCIGAEWKVMLIQIAIRRVILLLVLHVLSIFRYGYRYASYVLKTKQSLGCVIVVSAVDNIGIFIESNLKQRVIYGNMLLKIPFLCGESMTAVAAVCGEGSFIRILRELIFLEQMCAFGSPTMLILPGFAYGSIAFFRNLVNVETVAPWMMDVNKRKRYISQFVRGIFPYSKNGVLNDMV